MKQALSPTERAIRFGGMVLAHSALIASDLSEGELICPFAIVTKDDRREIIAFEAESQAEAVERGKTSLDEYKPHIDCWGLGRENLWSDPGSETRQDVLIVSAWTHGMDDPVILIQRFHPAATGHFLLVGEVEIILSGQVLPANESRHLSQLVSDGIALHPSCVPWATWLVH